MHFLFSFCIFDLTVCVYHLKQAQREPEIGKTNKTYIMKAKFLIIVVLGLLVLAPSCKKEVFPDRETLVGTWVVKDGPSNAYLEFTLWTVDIVYDGRQQYHYSPLNNTMYLYPDKYVNPESFSTHAIWYTEKTGELRVKDLLKDFADGYGYTTFKRQ
ncbi:MAG: hypothetical protein DRI88_04840 [Bacteroidetes bacterium]|nr:MAG: hypothetical protein DRI72_09655 [Bacteroidota bacterium]RLD47930.1 MAG: hypothetical protein DRI88_04840 [Bacteroidota bacterium]RLD86171.1 MAG: hypothetical protein DRJ02_09035 [Bacteroidota bacterium]